MNIKLLSTEALCPTRATDHSAGLDLYVPRDTNIKPGRNVVPLDVVMEIPEGMEGQIRPRSGFSSNGIEGISIYGNKKRFNADVLLGTIDSDYRGSVGVIIKSDEDEQFLLQAGTKIAQIIIAPYFAAEPVVCDELSETERGSGGFGHSGVK